MAARAEPSVSSRGEWQPTPILYGFATFPFQPASYGAQEAGSSYAEGQLVNPHQIPLEVGDEVYVFEQYISATRSAGETSEIWFRGYVVSTVRDVSSLSSLAHSTLTEAAISLAEEPQVYVGIYPANHIQIREQLEDGDKRIADLLTAQGSHDGMRADRTKSGHMAALPEEDETEASSPRLKLSPLLDRFPSSGVLAGPDGRRVVSMMPASGSPRLAQNGHVRPPPPLPSLKCGDETAAGVTEPLIDEIACALREWASLLQVYLLRRQYALFHTVLGHIDTLHAGRRKLLSRSLAAEEGAALRRELIERLVEGNTAQGLDIIVRHPDYGGLVEVELPEAGQEDERPMMGPARMFAHQMALAYKGASTALGQPDHAASALDASHDFAAPSERAKMHHVYVELRAFVGSLCTPGETAELAFSLFNKSDTRFVTEECCIIVDHHGSAPNTAMKTLFVDLSAHDMQDSMYLVCRIVKNGALRSGGNMPGTGPTTPGLNGFDDTHSVVSNDGAGTSASSNSMLHILKNGRQSVRRPYGCAVLDLGQLSEEGNAQSETDRPMPIFVPTSENAFSTLHEDIIASRIRDFEKSARADVVAVRVRAFHGALDDIVPDHPSLLDGVPFTQRLGFPDVVEPGLVRNDVYLKLWSGDFASGAVGRAAPGRNIEVGVEVRHSDGTVLRNVISRGSHEQGITHYSSMVFKGNNTPTFGELFKLEVAAEHIETCHVFFTFRHRTGKTTPSASDPPFAFAYLPLFIDSTFIPDGSHALVLYRYDPTAASPSSYLECAPVALNTSSPLTPTSLAKLMVVSRDSMIIRTFLCSTKYTQNEVLLRLLRWEKVLLPDPELLRTTLVQLRYCSEPEIAKHLRLVLDALFGILASTRNQAHELSDLIFADLVTILSIVADRRFNNFRPVLETYIVRHFVGSTVHTHLLRSMQALLSKRDETDGAQMLRSAIKVWEPLFRFILRSREIQRKRDVGMDVTHDHVEGVFRKDVSGVLSSINALMRATTPAGVIGTQTLAIQHFSGLLPSLSKIFPEEELVDVVVAFCEALPASASKGKPAVWKLLLLVNIVKSVLLAKPTSRATLVPYLVRWCKPHLGRYDDRAANAKDTQATKDNARMSWLEGSRLAVSVLAALSDRLQAALADPTVRRSRSQFAQEQDNAEYVLTLLPRLIETFRESEAAANVEALERLRCVAASVPSPFPASYPFSLVTFPPPSLPDADTSVVRVVPPPRPNLGSLASESAAVALALLHTAPAKILDNFLTSAFEVEGKDNFGRFLGNLFRFCLSVLEGAAWPATWLNVHILAHRVVLKLAEPAAVILEHEYIPPQQQSYSFNFGLWRDFLAMLMRVLVSEQLVIEEFAPQKRRAIWRLAGDLRGAGAKILLRLWEALGWPEGDAAQPKGMSRLGGYQIQLGPGLVEPNLELCLSHHDELRSNAVLILYSLIVNEWNLNEDFAGIQTDIIDRLDKLFSVKKRDDISVSQALFVSQLRSLFDVATISNALRMRVTAFLNSVSDFLELLLGIRNLPEGEEWTDDRVVGTLKLMAFVRGVTASPIFVRYIERLQDFHVASGHFAEAALTLKLHADLYSWSTTAYLDAIPEFGFARETEFARKETLYKKMIELLTQGRAWETALSLSKELQVQYETKIYAYDRLSETLARQALLYAQIVAEARVYPMYFRVGYYGRGFPVSVQNKQFVYRGNDMERLAAFCERMQNKFTKATMLKTNTPPDESTQFSDGQYLQIMAVTPEPDKSMAIFSDPDVPAAIKAYYEANETNLFSFTRALEKTVDQSIATLHHALLSRWVEKTVLVCEHRFPTVLRRTEVVEIRLIEQSPIETALLDIRGRTAELENLERRYLSASQTSGAKVNTNVLSMTLNSSVDTGDAGIPLYRRVFFSPQFTSSNPAAEMTALVAALREAIDQQVRSIDRCLKLHAALCPPEMQPFHETLERFFQQNFAEERRRLPTEVFPPAGFTLPSSPTVGSPTKSYANGITDRARAGSVSTLASRSGAISPLPPSILHSLAETDYEHAASTINGLGHASRFSESLVSQAPLSPTRPGPGVDVYSSPPSVTRTRSTKAADRLSALGARFGTLRRKKTS